MKTPGFNGVRNEQGDLFGLGEVVNFVDFNGAILFKGVLATDVVTSYHDSRDLVTLHVYEDDDIALKDQWLVDVSQIRKVYKVC